MNKLRSTFVVATVIAVCFAAMQLGGRALLSQLSHLEADVNRLLAAQGVVVSGIEGRWHQLNPVVFADRVRFPGGELVGFEFELDLIESLLRNQLVARSLSVADGFATLDADGAQGGGAALVPLLLHSDQVWLRGRLVVRGATLHAEAVLVNEASRHRFHVHVQSESRCTDCALTVDGDITAGGPGAVRVFAERFGVLGLSDLAVAGDWRRGDDGAAKARLTLSGQLATPAAPVALRLDAEAWSESGSRYRGRINELGTLSGDALHEVGGGFLVEGLAGAAPAAELWLDSISIDDAARLARAAFGDSHSVGLWTARLAPGGRLRDVRARIDRDGIAFRCAGDAGRTAGYKGVPAVDGLAFTISGHGRAARLDFDQPDFTAAVPDYLPGRYRLERGTGSLTGLVADGYAGLRGLGEVVLEGGTRMAGGFALARPQDPFDVHVAAALAFDRIDAEAAADYLPTTLSAELREYLRGSVQSGQLDNGRVGYHGHVKERGALPLRRTEFATRFAGGRMVYHPHWPPADAIDGQLAVTPEDTRLTGSARVFDTPLDRVRLRLPRRERRVHVAFRGEAPVERMIDFAWQTPTHEAMPFLSRSWTGAGDLDFALELALPLDGQALRPGDIRIDAHFTDASLDLRDLGLHFDAVDEDLRYVYPAQLTSDALHGTLFGSPVTIAIDSGDAAPSHEAVRFSLDGTATTADVFQLLGTADSDVVNGQFDFDAKVTAYPGGGRGLEVLLESDLRGVDVRLPAPLAKTSQETRPLRLALQFLDSVTTVSGSYGGANAWLHVADGHIRTGAIGIGRPSPTIDADAGRVVLSGGLDVVDSAALRELLQDDAESTMAWQLRKFRIDSLTLGDAELTDVVLDGHADPADVRISVTAGQLDGTVSRQADAPWLLHLTQLRLPAGETDQDPLDVAVVDRLVAADVVLDNVQVGGSDYGAWRFALRPAPDGVALEQLVVDARGLHIESTGNVFWSKRGVTSFEGLVTAGNLYEVLPQWDFAPTIESSSFAASGRLSWPGSPLNFDLAHLSGEASLEAADGRFLDVDQGTGAARIMSLVNFTTIAKRMNLDFSDIFGEGVSFDKATAQLRLDDGRAVFASPAEIDGTGSNFRIAGAVDLDTHDLDNEIVLTLPLRSSLPWYAAALALSNPASAAGVVVGAQVFKDQINRLSSVKYRISGTYDEPEVEFAGVFDNNIGGAPGEDESAAPEGGTEDTASGRPPR